MPRLLLAAPHKSSGKTTVTLGLCAALAQRGLLIQPFKKGPDYIDPMWLGAASGRPCQTLDPYVQYETEIIREFNRHAAGCDLALIEGNMGLFYHLDVMILAGIYTILALGLNIIVGFTGLLNLGFVAFYAIGAYIYGLLVVKFGFSFWSRLFP